jgi:hypothetical protein
MSKSNRAINAFIIDDQKDYIESLKITARSKRILLESSTNLETGMEMIRTNKNIDFVILDGKCFVDEDQESTGSTVNNIPVRALDQLKDINTQQNRSIRYCVNTGFYDDLHSHLEGVFTVFKKDDSEELLKFIIDEVSQSETYKLKNKYNECFEVFDLCIIASNKQDLLVKLVQRLENKNYDKDGFNVGREILEEIFMTLINNYVCIPEECLKSDGRPNLSYCSIFMGSRGTSYTLEISGVSFPNSFDIPHHISWTFGYLKENLSELSHAYSYDFSKYAFISATNGLLEILAWLPKFIKENFE